MAANRKDVPAIDSTELKELTDKINAGLKQAEEYTLENNPECHACVLSRCFPVYFAQKF